MKESYSKENIVKIDKIFNVIRKSKPFREKLLLNIQNCLRTQYSKCDAHCLDRVLAFVQNNEEKTTHRQSETKMRYFVNIYNGRLNFMETKHAQIEGL